MAGPWLKQSTAVTVKLGPFVDKTDGDTDEPGLTIQKADVRLSKNGGNMAACATDQGESDAGAAHDEIGYYDISLGTSDTDTLGRLKVMVHESGALHVWEEFMVVPANVWDSLFGADKLQVDILQVLGTTLTETSAGYLAAAFKKLFDVETPVLTAASVNQTGDSYAKIGTPVALDSGAATIAGMLLKLADDNGGADFDATTDSLHTLAEDTDVATAVWADATGAAVYAAVVTDAAGANIAADIIDIEGKVDDLEGRVVGTIAAGTHNPQSGDAYAVVAHADYGNAKLVRSTTPANALDVSATGEAGLDFNNVKQATGATTLTNITVPIVSTLTGHTAQTGDSYPIVSSATYGLAALKTIMEAFATTEDISAATWDHLLTAILTSGSVGKLIKDYLDAAISSRSTYAGGAVASVTAGVTLADDAITAAKYDQSTAHPLASADTGATAVARTGADADTLETLSDEIADAKAILDILKILRANKSIEDEAGTTVTYRNAGDTADAGTQTWDEASRTRGEYTAS